MSTEQLTINPTDYPVLEPIEQRWSPRSFSDRPVAPELLRQLFEAARWAPSSYNEQPWRFIVATKQEPEQFDRMLETLLPGNRQWAEQAPVLILTVIKETFDRNGKPNRSAPHDLGQAVGYLTLEATRHNLRLHQMAGINQEQARETFAIPEGYRPFTAVALGYTGDAKPSGNRSRKPIDEIAFQGSWEEREPIR